jgi:putative transposase
MNGHQLIEPEQTVRLRSETSFAILKGMYKTGSHSKYRLMYHLVWIPKYRKRVLQGNIAKRIEELFEQCANINGWKIEQLNIQFHHIHMLIHLKPNISVSKSVQLFKGGSSKKIREEFPQLEEFLWGDSFWADGYFAETVGKVNEDIIRNYIKNQ